MLISISKTDIMSLSRSPRMISFSGSSLQQTDEFKYLGSIFMQDSRHDRENGTQMQKANNTTALVSNSCHFWHAQISPWTPKPSWLTLFSCQHYFPANPDLSVPDLDSGKRPGETNHCMWDEMSVENYSYNWERHDQERDSQRNGWCNTHPPAHSAAVNQMVREPQENGCEPANLPGLLQEMLWKMSWRSTQKTEDIWCCWDPKDPWPVSHWSDMVSPWPLCAAPYNTCCCLLMRFWVLSVVVVVSSERSLLPSGQR